MTSISNVYLQARAVEDIAAMVDRISDAPTSNTAAPWSASPTQTATASRSKQSARTCS